MRRVRPEIWVGAFLLIISFAAALFVLNQASEGTVEVLRSLRDFQPGDIISMDMVEWVQVPSGLAAPYISINEPEFEGAVATIPISAGELLPKSSFVQAANPAAANRTALILSDPNMVAFVIPINEETAPPNISPGDRVDLILGVGSATFLSGQLSSLPTPNPQDPREVFTGTIYNTGQPGVFREEGDEFLGDAQGTGNVLPTPETVQVADHAEEEYVAMPIAKTLVHGAMVIRVIYEQEPNPFAAAEQGAAAYSIGPAKAIVVAVPIEVQELLTFALANGDLRVSLLSPLAEVSDQPTLGMSWTDLVVFFQAERQLIIDGYNFDQPLTAPGASLIWSILQATEQAQEEVPSVPAFTQTPTISAELTPTPTP
jgi:hypothetical protein